MRGGARIRTGFGVALLCLAAAVSAPASVSVRLVDGQVLEGTDVRRDGDEVLLTLASGQTISLPAETVAQIMLSGSGSDQPAEKAKAPTGFREGDPQTLSGPKVNAPNLADQTAAIGRPSTFQKNVIDPSWQPKSDWGPETDVTNFAPSQWQKGPIDSHWEPESAYDANKDVLADSKSTWQKSVIDSNWAPTDGFKKTGTSYASRPPTHGVFGSNALLASSGRSRKVAVAATRRAGPPIVTPIEASSAPAADPTVCATLLPVASAGAHEAAAPHVRRLEEAPYDALPFPVWEVEGRGTLFTVSRDECLALTQSGMSPALASSRALASMNAALDGASRPALDTDEKRVALAWATVAIADAAAHGGKPAEIRMLASTGALRDAGNPAGSCAESARKRRKALDRAATAFLPPTVDASAAGSVVRLWTWSAAGGVVARHDVLLGADGRIAMDGEVVARHLGAHSE